MGLELFHDVLDWLCVWGECFFLSDSTIVYDVYVSICVCVYLSMCLFIYISISLCVCVYLSMCIFIYISFSLSVYVYVVICVCVYLSLYVSVYPSIYVSIRLSDYLMFCVVCVYGVIVYFLIIVLNVLIFCTIIYSLKDNSPEHVTQIVMRCLTQERPSVFFDP